MKKFKFLGQSPISFLIFFVVASGLLFLSMTTLFLSGSDAETKAPPQGKVVGAYISMMEDPDPHTAKGGDNRFWKAPHTESLVSRDEKGEIVPKLATSWSVSPDGMSWEFSLRKGVKFHNGDPFTAEDVKFSYERYVDPKMKSGRGTLLRNTVKGVEILDAYKIRFNFASPDPAWLDHLFNNWLVIGPKKYTQEKGDNYVLNHPVGTGPFKFVKWESDAFMEWEAWTEHYEQPPKIKNLIIRVIAEPTTQAAQLRTGMIDLMLMTPPSIAKELESSGFRIERVPVGGQGMVWAFLDLASGVKDSPFQDKKVRLALNHAIDKAAIINKVFYGYARPGLSVVFPHAFGYNPNIKEYEYNPEKAKKLLAEAGYPKGFSTSIYANPSNKEAVEATASMLDDVGIKTDVVTMDVTAYYGKLRERSLKGIGYQNFQSEYDGAFHPMSFWWSKAAYLNYTDSTLDALLEKTKTMESNVREQALKDVLWYGHENVVYGQFVWADRLIALGPRIDKFPLRVGDFFSSMYENVTLKPGK